MTIKITIPRSEEVQVKLTLEQSTWLACMMARQIPNMHNKKVQREWAKDIWEQISRQQNAITRMTDRELEERERQESER